MIKLGSLLPCPFIICYNHTLHLAATDNIFSDLKSIEELKEFEEDQELDEEEKLDPNDESELLDGDEFEENKVRILPFEYQMTIKKMRTIIKIFSYPKANKILANEMLLKDQTPLKVKKDVITRWNSLLLACKRFLEILPYILSALDHKHIKNTNIFKKTKPIWMDEDTNALKVN
jgi:hypothetical protein